MAIIAAITTAMALAIIVVITMETMATAMASGAAARGVADQVVGVMRQDGKDRLRQRLRQQRQLARSKPDLAPKGGFLAAFFYAPRHRVYLALFDLFVMPEYFVEAALEKLT